jgi:hypothetical protein
MESATEAKLLLILARTAPSTTDAGAFRASTVTTLARASV